MILKSRIVKHRNFTIRILFTTSITVLLCLCVYIKNAEDIISIYHDKSIIANCVNISNIESCTYTVAAVGNQRTIGPCDYECYVFVKCNEEEINRIKSKYTFNESKPDFHIRHLDSKNELMSFSDSDILGEYNFCWGHSLEFENEVMKNSAYIGKVYFDSLNGFIYLRLSTI